MVLFIWSPKSAVCRRKSNLDPVQFGVSGCMTWVGIPSKLLKANRRETTKRVDPNSYGPATVWLSRLWKCSKIDSFWRLTPLRQFLGGRLCCYDRSFCPLSSTRNKFDTFPCVWHKSRRKFFVRDFFSRVFLLFNTPSTPCTLLLESPQLKLIKFVLSTTCLKKTLHSSAPILKVQRVSRF